MGVKMEKILTIAGSDCSGGAGIQADLKTITAHRMYGMSVITALTAQNTTGVAGVMNADEAFVEQQLDCVFQDIVPDAIKIGMVSNREIIKAIAKKLIEYQSHNVVVDPVMISTSGSRLLDEEAVKALVEELFPLARVITPNIPEAEVLSGIEIENKEDMKKAAVIIGKKINVAILIKGGHLEHSADDLLYRGGDMIWLKGEHYDNPNTHGTGCTLSSAIACNLARDYSMEVSVQNAKKYVEGAIKAGLDIGTGKGPLNHVYGLKEI